MRHSKTNVQRENGSFCSNILNLVIFAKSKEDVVNSYLLVVYSVYIPQNYILFQLEYSFTAGWFSRTVNNSYQHSYHNAYRNILHHPNPILGEAAPSSL